MILIKTDAKTSLKVCMENILLSGSKLVRLASKANLIDCMYVQPVGRPCGTWMHYAMRDVKDMGQQMGYRSL